MTELGEYLDLLDFAADEFVALFWKRGDEQHYCVIPSAAVQYAIGQIDPLSYDIYLAPNPTAGPARTDVGGRGKMADVTRCVAVYADLDLKPGACADETVMADIVSDLSGMLGTRPVASIFSGGGQQPIWLLEDCEPAIGAGLLRRFGRLVKRVAQERNANVDSVFDTARVLRVPGTVNHKYDPPRIAELLPDGGAALTPGELDERLTEAGVWDLGDDDELGTEIIAYPESIDWADKTCAYMRKLVGQWDIEPVQDRHPWLLSQYVRLECARRYQCFTEVDFNAAEMVLVKRFERLCGRPGDTRLVKRAEVADIRDEARDRASRKTDEQLRKELGGAQGHAHSLDSLIGDMSTAGLAPTESTVPQAIPEIIPGLIEAENNFWDRRDMLKEVYDYSLSRMCSPWAVLSACAAIALAWVRPCATLENIMGNGPGSLNSFIAIAAGSGQGKSTALRAAERLMPVSPFKTSVGSGEGMLESFAMRDPESKKIGVRESVLVMVDEIDLLLAMKARTGSSLLSLIKTAFTGGTLSLTYANKKYPVLKDNSYRLSMLCAVQPGKAGWVFEDQAGGFPQRFMWFPGNDARISKSLYRELSYTMGILLPSPGEFEYPREIIVPPEARDYIHDIREAAGQGDFDAGLDAHAAFARLKFAYALAVLDARAVMNLEDWQLSGVAAKVSGLTRDWVQRGIRAERTRDATERGEFQGTVRAVSEEAQSVYSAVRAEAVMSKVAGKIREAAALPDRDLRNAFPHRDRRYVAAALQKLAEDKMIRAEQAGPKGGIVWVWVS